MLSKNPEIEKCYQKGLINRRSLARYVISAGLAKESQLEAVIAMLRRFRFREFQIAKKDFFMNVRISIKDNILVLDFEKDKELVKKLQKIVSRTDYDKGDTLKIVLGSASVKLFIDKAKEHEIKEIIGEHKPKRRHSDISEISVLFPSNTTEEKGILSAITRELAVNDITITELLTASPELLIYVKERYVLKAFEVLKDLQKR
jgi:hypothetical protein